jgi:hypothetical protein
VVPARQERLKAIPVAKGAVVEGVHRLPRMYVRKEVRKYGSEGELQAFLPPAFHTSAHPASPEQQKWPTVSRGS